MLKKFKNKRKELSLAPSSFDNAVINWKAPEYPKYKKGIFWKIFASLLLISVVLIGYFYNAWSFTAAIFAFALVYFLLNREEPKNVEVILSNIGIKVGNRKYPYSHIKAFWIIYEPPYFSTLHIRVKNDIAVDITIELGLQDPSIVREFLIDKIPEMEGQNYSVSDLFVRLFKL